MRTTIALVFVLVFAVGFSVKAWAGSIGSSPGYGSQLYGPDGGTATPAMDTQNRLYARTQQRDAPCSAIIHTTVVVGTTPVTVPASRTAGSIGVEIENSILNTGSPKLKCTPDPADGGVGMGLTDIGLPKNPGEPMFFGLDSSHVVKCVSDTAGTAAVTSECVP